MYVGTVATGLFSGVAGTCLDANSGALPPIPQGQCKVTCRTATCGFWDA
jgi:hypothetical protein